MSKKAYHVIIEKLCGLLGLAELAGGDTLETVLSVDALEVVLRHGEDGQALVIEVEAGSILGRSSAEYARLEKLLRTNLALSAVRNAIAVLEPRGDGDEAVINVRGYYRYRHEDVRLLSDLVAEVVASGETLRAILSGRSEAGGQSEARGLAPWQSGRGSMYFNP